MKKNYLIEQPPNSDYYNLLVQDKSENGMFGVTQDISQIDYNREIIGEWFDIEVAIKQLINEHGVTTAFQCGTYICVLQLKYDNSEGTMTFYDFEGFRNPELIETLETNNVYSKPVLDGIRQLFQKMEKSEVQELDTVRLVVPFK